MLTHTIYYSNTQEKHNNSTGNREALHSDLEYSQNQSPLGSTTARLLEAPLCPWVSASAPNLVFVPP